MSTLIVGAAVLAVTVLAARKVYRDKKNGKCCGGNCAGCSGNCHSR